MFSFWLLCVSPVFVSWRFGGKLLPGHGKVRNLCIPISGLVGSVAAILSYPISPCSNHFLYLWAGCISSSLISSFLISSSIFGLVVSLPPLLFFPISGLVVSLHALSSYSISWLVVSVPALISSYISCLIVFLSSLSLCLGWYYLSLLWALSLSLGW